MSGVMVQECQIVEPLNHNRRENLGMTPLEIGLTISLFTIIVGALLAFIVKQNRRMDEHDKLLTILNTQVSPMWATVQARMSADLHHPNQRYAEMDRLLEKLESLVISDLERQRLKELLLIRSVDMHEDITESQRKSALAMIPLMDLVVIEAKQQAEQEGTK